MPERFDADAPEAEPPDVALPAPGLPAWLARRLLRRDEQIAWVRGPRWVPSWERWLTHPVQFVVALALAAACVGAGRLFAGTWSAVPVPFFLGAGGILLASIYVLAIAAAYFTRLVVTNFRLVIVQGCDVVRTWGLDQLPRSLVRYDPRRAEQATRTVDLTALQTLLGDSPGQFTDAKTIRALGKRLEQIKARERGQP
jgi:hypothetical protein